MTKNDNWLTTFKHALEGCAYAFLTQKNFKIHLILSFIVLALAFWLKISFEQFLLLIFLIIFGLTVEMANTAFEKTVDLIAEEYSPKAKIAKDISAGMMLVASIGLAILGLLIFLPPLWHKISNF